MVIGNITIGPNAGHIGMFNIMYIPDTLLKFMILIGNCMSLKDLVIKRLFNF